MQFWKITELLNNKFKQDILSLTLYFEKFSTYRKVERLIQRIPLKLS